MGKAKSLFNGDESRMAYLMILYLAQGIPYSFFLFSYPIILKKYFDYTDIGIITWCSFAIPFKIFLTPLVQNTYNERIGKRKSWIIPASMAVGLILLFLGYSIDHIVEFKRVYLLAFSST
jgi:MFS transporter, PAT family, solute carrier family 33 (acetyl-CoA transportor), member 1